MTFVKGGANLNAALSALSADIATKIGQAADRAGAVVIQKAIIAAAPIGPTEQGAMQTRRGRQVAHSKINQSVKVKKTKNISATAVQTTITTTTAVQSVWEEFGSIHNPPTRFMSKAVDAAIPAAIEKITSVLKTRIDKAKQ